MKGRKRIVSEFYRVLRKGGRVVIGDVAKNTTAQRHFDAIDNPIYCAPRGHPHDFLDKKSAIELFQVAGFKKIHFEIDSTPWIFKDEKEAQTFLHTIHNAKCSPEESLKIAKEHLLFRITKRGFELGWELFFLTAAKDMDFRNDFPPIQKD